MYRKYKYGMQQPQDSKIDTSKNTRLLILLLYSMQNIADFVNFVINNYHIDSSIIHNVQGCLGEEWKPNGWISLILCNRECIVLQFNNGVFMNQGFCGQ